MHSGQTTESRRIGPYRLRRRIAVGGMAEIFEAYEEADAVQERLVVKLMLPEYAKDPDLVRAFAHEATLAQRLVHPSLIRVIDHGGAEPDPYIVMEYVDGVTLAQLLQHLRAEESLLDTSVCLYVIGAVLRALHYVHEARDEGGEKLNVVHRDITPQNILLSRGGEVKLGDFGIARSSLRSARTRTGVIKGKLRYLAPEQVTGSDIDARTDIYSTGLVLFEALTGRPYYEGSSEVELIREAEQPSSRKPSEFLPSIDAKLDNTVARALARFPEGRWPSARAMLKSLHAAEDDEVRNLLAELVSAASVAGFGPTPVEGRDEVPTKVERRRVDGVAAGEAMDGADEGAPSRSRGWVALPLALAMSAGIFWWTTGRAPTGNTASDEVADAPIDDIASDEAVSEEAVSDDETVVPENEADEANEAEGTVDAETEAQTPPPNLAAQTKRGRTPGRRRALPRETMTDSPDEGEGRQASVANDTALEVRPSEDVARAELQADVDELTSTLRSRQLHRNDLSPASRRALAQVRRALAGGGDIQAATERFATVRREVSEIRVDAPFVQRKMRRVDEAIARARRRGVETAELEGLASAALEDFMAGRYEATNARLNRITDHIER